MRFIRDLFTYGIKDKKVDRIADKIKRGKKINKLFLVTLPLFDDGIMEVYQYNQLLQPYYAERTDDIIVVGMSIGKNGANEIILDIIQRMTDAGYGASLDVRGFLNI